MPRVSIVTPCYNAATFVAETIESVRQQTFENWEYIIVDDGSNDSSRRVIERFLNDARIRLVSKEHGGVASARNFGYAHTDTRTEYVLFLDADDTLQERMLERMVHHLDDHPGAGLANCGFMWIDENGIDDERNAHSERLAPRFPLPRVMADEEAITPFSTIYAAGGLVPTMSTVFRRSVYDKTSGFDESFGQGYEDSDLVLRTALLSEVHYVSDKLYRYRRRAGQHSSDSGLLREQREKLFAKLKTLPDLSREQRERLMSAEDFRLGPYAALQSLRHARVLLRAYHWPHAAKQTARALVYAMSGITRRAWHTLT